MLKCENNHTTLNRLDTVNKLYRISEGDYEGENGTGKRSLGGEQGH